MVLNTLQAAAVKYYQRHGRVPVLFLDGADVLAKHDPPLFNRLLVHTKVLANAKDLSIIFVSSEGLVLSLLEDSSKANRALKVLEILDISEGEAVDYLISKNVERSTYCLQDC